MSILRSMIILWLAFFAFFAMGDNLRSIASSNCDGTLQNELPFNHIHTLADAQQFLSEIDTTTNHTRQAVNYVLQHQFLSYEEVLSTFRLLFMTIVNLSWRFHAFIDQGTSDQGFSGPGTDYHPSGQALLVRKNGNILTGYIENAKNLGPDDPPTSYRINPANFRLKGKVKILTLEERELHLKSKILQMYDGLSF